MRVAMWILLGATSGLLASDASDAARYRSGWYLVSGSVPLDGRGPDGNSILLDAPDGLILIDSGRHPAHAEKLIAYARARGRPVVAIVNTHWHLDHTTGNHDIRRAFPRAPVYASRAIEGALVGFLRPDRARVDQALADPATSAARRAEMKRALSVVDRPDRLRPTRPILASGRRMIAGRTLDVRVAHFAATEADVWLYDSKHKLVVAGDLVVDIVPFMDTACVDGWRRALEAIAATPFTTLVPGHGAPMSRPQFLHWKRAFDRFVDCGRSSRPAKACVAGWKADAAPFIAASHSSYVDQAAAYYLGTRLRASADEQARYCRPLAR